MYHGETISGTCGLCNQSLPVTLRIWFVCPLCWNVVVAYQKSLVASSAIRGYWNEEVLPRFPDLELQETEELQLKPFVRQAKTKREASKSLAALDFRVSRSQPPNSSPLFHIEQKSGPGAIEEMKEFQLDVNDYEDVVGACLYTGYPAYIFHVQLTQEYESGTRRVVSRGIWYTDILRLRQELKRIAARRGEDKQAAYFRPSAFQPLKSFASELESERYLQLANEVKSSDLSLPGRL